MTKYLLSKFHKNSEFRGSSNPSERLSLPGLSAVSYGQKANQTTVSNMGQSDKIDTYCPGCLCSC